MNERFHRYRRRCERVSIVSVEGWFEYANAGDAEAVSGGILNGISLSHGRDGFGRRSGCTVALGAWSESTSYAYDPRSRIQVVSSGSDAAEYTYLPNSPLIESIFLKNEGSTKLTTTRAWDSANRLQTMTNSWSGGSRSMNTTLFDAMNRRKQVAWEDGSKWDFGYNDRGEVTSGTRKWSDGTAVSGQQFGYAFDNIGNRTNATENGRLSVYTPDSLNRYGQRSVPGVFDVLGTAASGATVTVNGTAAQRKGAYFYKDIAVDNSVGPVLAEASIQATATSGTTQRTIKELVPKSPEIFGYDLDGNLTSDGRWDYTWDAENRLVGLSSRSTIPEAAKRKLAFVYDAQGRRIRTQVWHGVQGNWLLHHTIRFAYDGWNLIAELADNDRRIRTYVWGLDMSGSFQGAGGIGGLLFEKDHFGSKNFAVCYDLNGNVSLLLDLATNAPAVFYEYDPFGKTLRASGEYATLNPFRFSTKYAENETELLYYGFRFYSPVTGRWLSRDPVNESGHLAIANLRKASSSDNQNPYLFAFNDGISHIDVLGLDGYLTIHLASGLDLRIQCRMNELVGVGVRLTGYDPYVAPAGSLIPEGVIIPAGTWAGVGYTDSSIFFQSNKLVTVPVVPLIHASISSVTFDRSGNYIDSDLTVSFPIPDSYAKMKLAEKLKAYKDGIAGIPKALQKCDICKRTSQ